MAVLKNGFYNVSSKGNPNINVGASNEAIARAAQYGNGTYDNGSFGNNVAVSQAQANPVINYTGGSSDSGGSGSGGSSASVTSASGGFNAADYLSSLFNSYAAQRQAQLQAAYDRSKANIENAFGESRGLLDQNYNSSVDSLNSSYNNSLKGLQDDAAKSLKEAYVNKMLSQKNLNQKMSAAGLSGGATETTLANMLNNYGNARNNINTTLNSNIGDLNATRDNNMASILQNYNSNLMNLVQQRANALTNIENALAGGMADALGQQFSFQTSGNYLNALTDALNNMSAFQGRATSANNPVNMLSTNQVGVDNVSSNTNYEEYMRQLMALMGA